MAVFDSETYGDKVDFRRIGPLETHVLPGGFEIDSSTPASWESPVWDACIYAPSGYYFSQQGLHAVVVHSAAEARDEMAHIALCSEGGCNRDCEENEY
jgi:hypothetical protein